MNAKKTSQQKSYRRSLQLESLEQRCLLALTVAMNVDAGAAADTTIIDCDTKFVAKAFPAGETADGVCHCAPATDIEADTFTTIERDLQLIECFVDEENSTIGEDPRIFAIEDDADYPQVVFDIIAVQRTLDEPPPDVEPFDPATMEVLMTFLMPPQEVADGDEVGDEHTSDGEETGDGEAGETAEEVEEEVTPDDGSEPVETIDEKPPVIYYLGPPVEVIADEVTKPTEDTPPFTPPILHTTHGESDRDPPPVTEKPEEPVIYTFGGEAAESSGPTNGGASEVLQTTSNEQRPSRLSTRQRLRERMVGSRDRNLDLISRPSIVESTPTTPVVTTADDAPAATDNDTKPVVNEIEQLGTQSLRHRARGRRSGGRR